MKTIKNLLRAVLGAVKSHSGTSLIARSLAVVELIYPMVRDFSRGGWSFDSFVAVMDRYKLGGDVPPYPQSVDSLKAFAADRIKRYLLQRGYPSSLVNLALELAVQRVKLEVHD
jgi:hypothetical protein